jgi:hypothetical protein
MARLILVDKYVDREATREPMRHRRIRRRGEQSSGRSHTPEVWGERALALRAKERAA